MDRREGPIATVNDFEEIYEWRPPTHKIVCPTCNGRGSHVNPSIDGNGLTSEDLQDWDEEDFDFYRSGGYDVICHECGGKNVVDEVDEDQLTPEQLKQWIGYLNDVADYRAEIAAETRAGC